MKINWTAAAVVVPVALAAVGGLWTLYAYYNPAATKPEQTASIEYEVCTGSREAGCKPHNAFIHCGENIQTWAAEKCRTFQSTVVQSEPGGMCGYSITKITCTAKK